MGRLRILPQSFYRRSPEIVARELLGRDLVRRLDKTRLVLRVMETEAYLGAKDPASHAWRGRRTPRTAALYRDGGHAYVYFIYGMYYCLNAVTGNATDGGAVLIRAGAPVSGEETMREHRALRRRLRPGDLAGGPGKLCQALAIDAALNGATLYRGELTVRHGEPVNDGQVAIGPRVGIAYAGEAADWPLRFAYKGDPNVSRPFPW